MSRLHEVRQVQEDRRDEWLANQIDELERVILNAINGLSDDLKALRAELEANREQAVKDRIAANYRTIATLLTVMTALVTLRLTNATA